MMKSIPFNGKYAAVAAVLMALFFASADPAAAAASLCYKVTSKMWDASSGKAVTTSPEVLGRIRRAFRLWEMASGDALKFRDGGFSAPGYDGLSQIPYDGCVHAVLYGERNFHGELGHGGFNGTIPGEYKRGYFFINRTDRALDGSTLTHEIGHALGLGHSATPASVMLSGVREWGREAPRRLSEQDCADLRALWAPGLPGLYSISGTINTSRRYPIAFVFAVNARNGRTYSTRADPMGRFSIAMMEPGEYHIAAKAAEVSMDLLPAATAGISAGWYVSDDVSDELAHRAAVLKVSKAGPAIRGLRLKTIDKISPFPLTRAVVRGGGSLSSLKPGDEAVLEFPEAVGAVSLEPYGSRPDYSFQPVPRPGGRGIDFKLKISPGAEPGERLAVARDRDGRTVIGLVGINIVPKGGLRVDEASAAPAAGTAAEQNGLAAAPPARTRSRAAAGVTLLLTFNSGFDDEGPYRFRAVPNGNQVRLVPGRRGQALFIGGTEDWLDIPMGNPVSLAGGLTLELWVKRDDWMNPYKGGSGWQTIAALGTEFSLAITAPGCPLHKPWALEGSASRYRADVKETESSRVLSAPGSVAAKRWTHAALVYDQAQGTLSLYQNGKLLDIARGVPPMDFGRGRLRLGTWHKANQAFRGEIDDVVIYNYPRLPADIAADAAR
jgi:hypothetical protein